MPLEKSKSPAAFKRNVRTLMGEVGKSPHVQSRSQALAVAYSIKRRGKAEGGEVDDPIMPMPRNPAAPADWAQNAVRGAAGKVGDIVMAPRRAMDQGMTTADATDWAGDVATTMAGTGGLGAARGALGTAGGKLVQPQGIRAFHSSPHDFDKFDFSKIGTGEGAQVYGHGGYFAENPAVSGQGGQYWNQFQHRFEGPEGDAASYLALHNFDRQTAAKAAREQLNKNIDFAKNVRSSDELASLAAQRASFEKTVNLLEGGSPVGPRTYEVNIAARPEQMLDWDKPLAQQPEGIQRLVAEGPSRLGGNDVVRGQLTSPTGENIYRRLSVMKGNTGAPKVLQGYDVPGIRYLDQESRLATGDAERLIKDVQRRLAYADEIGASPAARKKLADELTGYQNKINAGTHNYVMFPGTEDKVKILKKYGVAGVPAAGAAAAATEGQRPIAGFAEGGDVDPWQAGVDAANRAGTMRPSPVDTSTPDAMMSIGRAGDTLRKNAPLLADTGPGRIAQALTRVVTGQTPIPPHGMRREDYTDDPNAPQPIEPLVNDAMNVADVMSLGSMPMATKGAAGIFGGRLAVTADHQALNRAQAMAKAGAPREAIWNDTGWFKGGDDKWRFEIPDNKAKLTRDWLTSSLDTSPNKVAANKYALLEGAIKHPDAFDAYPDTRMMGYRGRFEYGPDTILQRKTDTGEIAVGAGGGHYIPSRDSIDAGGFGYDRPQAKAGVLSTTLHELQHAIQSREGFVPGASPSDFMYQNSPLFKYRGPLNTAEQAYRRVAGEVEARNVQARMNMTPEERRAKPPWLTEDVPAGQQIFGAQAPVGPQMSAGIPPKEPFRIQPQDIRAPKAANVNTSKAEVLADLPPPLSPSDRIWQNYVKRMGPDEMLKSGPVWSAAENLSAAKGISPSEAFAEVANDMFGRMGANRFMTPAQAKMHMARERGVLVPVPAEGLTMKRPISGFAAGGSPDFKIHPSYIARAQSRSLGHTGPISSMVPGRTDHHAMSVPRNSYVVPADIASGLGQGNTAAGMKVLGAMFPKSGPYGSPAAAMHRGTGIPRPPRADGGAADGVDQDVPIYAAGGEFIVAPADLHDLGGGDFSHAHAVMDAWVKSERKKLIKTLKSLPGPAKD
jgi:hypothetical protein